LHTKTAVLLTEYSRSS